MANLPKFIGTMKVPGCALDNLYARSACFHVLASLRWRNAAITKTMILVRLLRAMSFALTGTQELMGVSARRPQMLSPCACH